MNEIAELLESTAGKAWRVNIDEVVRVTKWTRPHSSIARWFIQAAWAHPIWPSYILDVQHLRPLEGLKPPKIYLTGATHEMTLAALDPQWKINHMESAQPHMLWPLNFAAQFICDSDEAAAKKIRDCVVEIMEQKLSPDTDFIGQWVDRFNDSMIRKEFK